MAIDVLAVVGPTASGKTRRAVSLARAFGGEIISADSRQVYRRMDIGTGKDLDEYGDVPVHLVDVCEAGEKYNLHRYLSDFTRVRDDISSRGRLPVVCGGSGMYVEAALSGIVMPEVPCDPKLRDSLAGKSLTELASILGGMKQLHNVTDIDTPARAVRAIEIAAYYAANPGDARLADRAVASPLNAVVIGIDIPRDLRRQRIDIRLDARLEQGMVEEVRALLDSGLTPADLIYYGLEYKFLTLYIIGKLTRGQMRDGLATAIHQFAKRQMTWFRGMERRGFHINWLPYDMREDEFTEAVADLISEKNNYPNK